MEELLSAKLPSPPVDTFIVLDTNIFAKQTRLLKTGASIKRVKIVMPEVVRSETTRYALHTVCERWKTIADGFKQIREYMGESFDPPAPTQEVILKAVNERFDALTRWMKPVPITDDLIKRAAHGFFRKYRHEN